MKIDKKQIESIKEKHASVFSYMADLSALKMFHIMKRNGFRKKDYTIIDETMFVLDLIYDALDMFLDNDIVSLSTGGYDIKMEISGENKLLMSIDYNLLEDELEI